MPTELPRTCWQCRWVDSGSSLPSSSSIVPLSIGMVGQPVQTLPLGSYVVVAFTFLAGIVATILQTRYADNTQ
jgi:hypothetical protein